MTAAPLHAQLRTQPPEAGHATPYMESPQTPAVHMGITQRPPKSSSRGAHVRSVVQVGASGPASRPASRPASNQASNDASNRASNGCPVSVGNRASKPASGIETCASMGVSKASGEGRGASIPTSGSVLPPVSRSTSASSSCRTSGSGPVSSDTRASMPASSATRASASTCASTCGDASSTSPQPIPYAPKPNPRHHQGSLRICPECMRPQPSTTGPGHAGCVLQARA